MKQTAVLKSLRIVPVPITEDLMKPPISINRPFQKPVPIVDSLRAERQVEEPVIGTASEEKEKKEDIAVETAVTDPLLALAGTLKCNLSEIEISPVAEMRVKEGSLPPEVRASDPLLALAGTLECDVTDIGERHDEYIVDTLVAELRGNDDE